MAAKSGCGPYERIG